MKTPTPFAARSLHTARQEVWLVDLPGCGVSERSNPKKLEHFILSEQPLETARLIRDFVTYESTSHRAAKHHLVSASNP